MVRTRPSPIVMIVRGVFQRCPRCGGGHVFRRWFTMVERCPTCGLKFEREEGYFLGAFVINFGVVLITLGAFIALSMALTLPDPPVVLLSIMGMMVSAAVALVFYPSSRTVWSAFDLWMRWLDGDEERDAAEAVLGFSR